MNKESIIKIRIRIAIARLFARWILLVLAYAVVLNYMVSYGFGIWWYRLGVALVHGDWTVVLHPQDNPAIWLMSSTLMFFAFFGMLTEVDANMVLRKLPDGRWQLLPEVDGAILLWRSARRALVLWYFVYLGWALVLGAPGTFPNKLGGIFVQGWQALYNGQFMPLLDWVQNGSNIVAFLLMGGTWFVISRFRAIAPVRPSQKILILRKSSQVANDLRQAHVLTSDGSELSASEGLSTDDFGWSSNLDSPVDTDIPSADLTNDPAYSFLETNNWHEIVSHSWDD